MSDIIIQIKDLSAGYGGRTAIRNVSLNVYDKDFLGIIGPNGGGKTTLIKVMLGLLKPSHGSVDYFRNGKKVNEITMGYLPQYNVIDKKFRSEEHTSELQSP